MTGGRLPCAIFGALLVGAVVILLATTGGLPERIPTHFGAGGVPDAWMTRGGYTAFMLVFAVGLPIVIAWAIGGLPRAFPNQVNLPNRDHWLAPERREASLAFLGRHACWLGCMMVLMAAGVHVLLLRASASTPPRLEERPFIALLVAFVAALLAWIVAIYKRFPRVK
ncbi:MAG TPA: DUF1648 domain-containing protein [Burkholderiales bacterium]|nr:DUF1648 domain-containing protein [Burkholderiales bacterium]